MHSIKSTSILWLGAAVLSLSAACVDDNKAPPPVMKPPAVGACGEGVKAVTVPIFTPFGSAIHTSLKPSLSASTISAMSSSTVFAKTGFDR